MAQEIDGSSELRHMDVNSESLEVSIIFPVYNEGYVIERTISSFYKFLQSGGYSFELIAVDDASTDETSIVLEGLVSRLDLLRVIRLEHNSGKGAAVRKGIMASNGRYVFFTDSDLVI